MWLFNAVYICYFLVTFTLQTSPGKCILHCLIYNKHISNLLSTFLAFNPKCNTRLSGLINILFHNFILFAISGISENQTLLSVK